MKNLINKSEVQTYKNIKDFIINNNLSIIKLYIYEELTHFTEFEQLNEQQQIEILNSIHSYWLHNDFMENDLYNIIDITMQYIKQIIESNFDYLFFESIINKNL